MSAKPIGKMIGGMFGFRDDAAQDPQAPPDREAEAGVSGAAPVPQSNAQDPQGGDANKMVASAEAEAGAAAEVAATPAASGAEKEQSQIDLDLMEERLIDAMRTVYDPEIPVDIYELGLIYSLRVRPGGIVDIEMTLTTPNCPVAGSMPSMVENVARMVEGVTDVHVELVWDPIWNPEMMSEAARLQLNMY